MLLKVAGHDLVQQLVSERMLEPAGDPEALLFGAGLMQCLLFAVALERCT